jgi:AraC-like DNA-binding protein
LLLGYADQAHLIRSLQRFIGQTPAMVVNSSRESSLSFSFNTTDSFRA